MGVNRSGIYPFVSCKIEVYKNVTTGTGPRFQSLDRQLQLEPRSTAHSFYATVTLSFQYFAMSLSYSKTSPQMAFLKYQVVPQLNDKNCIVVRIKRLIVTSFEMGYEPSLLPPAYAGR